MKIEDITPAQLAKITTIERVGSCLSLFGCAIIFLTFCFSRGFNKKPINRIVFYASMGNVMGNVGTLIARSALDNPSSALCQFQAFAIQMSVITITNVIFADNYFRFLPADAYWAFAMAMNVYLTFHWHFSERQLRRVEIVYGVACYGVPCIIALVYLFVKSDSKGKMYGNATLWCWVGSNWDVFRIVTFYAPVWFVDLCLSRWRKKLIRTRAVVILSTLIYLRTGRAIWQNRQNLRNLRRPAPEPIIIPANPVLRGNAIVITTVRSTPKDDATISGDRPGGFHDPTRPNPNFSATITAGRHSPPESVEDLNNLDAYSYKVEEINDRGAAVQVNMVTSDPQRAYEHMNSSTAVIQPARFHGARAANAAAWSYTKVAGLFFIAMMVTWVPSSANRVYSLAHPNEISIGLQYASALVLPLQGFWNAVIYIMTSLPAVKSLYHRTCGSYKSRNFSLSTINLPGQKQNEVDDSRPDSKGSSKVSKHTTDTDDIDMQPLAHPTTKNPTRGRAQSTSQTTTSSTSQTTTTSSEKSNDLESKHEAETEREMSTKDMLDT